MFCKNFNFVIDLGFPICKKGDAIITSPWYPGRDLNPHSYY
jgi:hypothetical protein